MDARQTLDRYFIEMRWRCLSLAADLDRVHRAPGGPDALATDPRLVTLRRAIAVLQSSADPDRAARVQMIFSEED